MSAVPVRSSRPAARIRPQAPALTMVRNAPTSNLNIWVLLSSIIMVVLGAGVAAGFNSLAAQEKYEANNLQVQLNILNDEYESMRASALAVSSPQELARRAAELGLVQAGSPGTVTLATGEVAQADPAK
ncbi:MAG: hypothetical protein Q3999_04395 [Buchananella hordeovulneris]|nr:hypothetical protein [Buchananella hordeovulneris]